MPFARPFRMAAAVGVLTLAATTSGCATSAGSATSNQNTNYVVTGGGVITTYAIGHRKAAPEVAGTDLDGKPLDLAQFKGKVIVLNFWASWCPPCRAEAPALEAVSGDTASLGVQFIGVDIRETGSSDGANFVATHDINYPSFADPSARIALEFRGTGIPPETPPSTLVIDRTGHIAARGLGEMRVDQLKSLVQDVAKESA
ncbi:MAG: TlpA family protein disulfide reductase [Acidothermaceae bacterium]